MKKKLFLLAMMLTSSLTAFMYGMEKEGNEQSHANKTSNAYITNIYKYTTIYLPALALYYVATGVSYLIHGGDPYKEGRKHYSVYRAALKCLKKSSPSIFILPAVKMLIDSSSDEQLQKQDVYGATPLNRAIQYKQKEIAQWLMQRNAPLNEDMLNNKEQRQFYNTLFNTLYWHKKNEEIKEIALCPDNFLHKLSPDICLLLVNYVAGCEQSNIII